MIDDSGDNNIDNNIIDYWHEEFQLLKNDENIFFNLNGWLNDQHLSTTMQILYVQWRAPKSFVTLKRAQLSQKAEVDGTWCRSKLPTLKGVKGAC